MKEPDPVVAPKVCSGDAWEGSREVLMQEHGIWPVVLEQGVSVRTDDVEGCLREHTHMLSFEPPASTASTRSGRAIEQNSMVWPRE